MRHILPIRYITSHKVGFLLFQRPIWSLGHHTLGLEGKGVLSTGVDKMLFGYRASAFAPIQIFPPRERKRNCPHGSETPVAGTGMADPTEQAGYFSQAQ